MSFLYGRMDRSRLFGYNRKRSGFRKRWKIAKTEMGKRLCPVNVRTNEKAEIGKTLDTPYK